MDKMKRIWLMILAVVAIGLHACQKEYSFESSSNMSEGSLQSDVSGDCLPKIVGGTYEAGTVLSGEENFLQVEVDVTLAGSYVITTDTINGFYFRGTGVFAATGLTTVKLQGNGTPVNSGISNFTVTYLASSCAVPVTVLPAGGAVPAEFTFVGDPDECMDADVMGDYKKGVATNSSHFVTIIADVTTAGTYSITTVVSNGISFSGSGVLEEGEQTITLYASGTPISATGSTNIPVTAGSSSCSFSVNVTDEPANPTGFTWKFTSGATTYSGNTSEAIIETMSGISVASIECLSDANEELSMGITFTNTSGGIGTGDYKSTNLTGKIASIIFIPDGITAWIAAPTFGSLTAKVTEYNTSTKVIAGTFSGTLVDENSNTMPVTNGTFRAKLP